MNLNRRRSGATSLYGLLHFTCAVGTTSPHIEKDEQAFEFLTRDRASRFREDLGRMFLPDGGCACELTALYESSEAPPHTWLIARSRHTAIKHEQFLDSDVRLPTVLDWRRAGSPSYFREWRTGIRVQKTYPQATKVEAGDGDSDGQDCNDYLVTIDGEGHTSDQDGELEKLRRFVAVLMAQRRSEIFASDLSARMYHVWLPPGLVVPDSRCDPVLKGGPNLFSSSYALLPYVTLVRRPYRDSWRQTVSVSFVFVPWAGLIDAAASPPRITAHDVDLIVGATWGSSTYIPRGGRASWALEDSPLREYLATWCGDDSARAGPAIWGEASGACPPVGATLRQWLEQMIFAAAKAHLPDENETVVADEVLRAMRLTRLWSVLLLSKPLNPASSGPGAYVDNTGCWWPQAPGRGNPMASVPREILGVLRELAQRDRVLLPTGADRIDVTGAGGTAYMSWYLPNVRAVVTAYSLREEAFPRFSAVNLFGRLAHVAVAGASAQATLDALGRAVSTSKGIDHMANEAHERVLELEEMYDLDIAWPEYTRFYQRLRSLAGLDRQYAHVRDRVDLLARFFEIKSRADQETRRDETFKDLKLVGRFAIGPAVALVLFAIISALLARDATMHRWSLLAIILAISAVLLVAIGSTVAIFKAVDRRERQRHPDASPGEAPSPAVSPPAASGSARRDRPHPRASVRSRRRRRRSRPSLGR